VCCSQIFTQDAAELLTRCDACSETLCTTCAGPGSWDLGRGTETVYTRDDGRKPMCRECLWAEHAALAEVVKHAPRFRLDDLTGNWWLHMENVAVDIGGRRFGGILERNMTRAMEAYEAASRALEGVGK
jgi:hypothetical protein